MLNVSLADMLVCLLLVELVVSELLEVLYKQVEVELSNIDETCKNVVITLVLNCTLLEDHILLLICEVLH